MKQFGFDDLERLPILRYYEAAFSKATGVSLRVMAPRQSREDLISGRCENAFCDLVVRTPAGCGACAEAHVSAQRRVAEKLVPQQLYCFAGLMVVAVPVVVAGQHVATLLSGQVFRRQPTEDDFAKVVRLVGTNVDPGWEAQARKAFFETPVVSEERFQAIVYLLSVFAQYLADYASRCAIGCGEEESGPVAGAKRFVQTHVEEPFMLKRVLQHVHVSRFYFCKLFKKSTGMTLTEYVARVRVEKAKTLLVDPSLRITDVVYAAGFGSIPRFNSVFKRYVGMPPREYRASLRSELTRHSSEWTPVERRSTCMKTLGLPGMPIGNQKKTIAE